MGCDNRKNNLSKCNCSYEPCSKKGNCCECVAYHRDNDELPACFFDEKTERTYDRSFKSFVNMLNKRGK